MKDHHQEEFHNTQSRNNVRKKRFICEPLNQSSVDKTAVYTKLLLERQTPRLLPPSINWCSNVMRSRWGRDSSCDWWHGGMVVSTVDSQQKVLGSLPAGVLGLVPSGAQWLPTLAQMQKTNCTVHHCGYVTDKVPSSFSFRFSHVPTLPSLTWQKSCLASSRSNLRRWTVSLLPRGDVISVHVGPSSLNQTRSDDVWL